MWLDSSMMLWCIAACTLGELATCILSVPVPGENGVIVEVSVRADEPSSNHRATRTADSDLPDHLSCGFPLHNDNIVLLLKRSRLLPVVTSDAQQMESLNLIPYDSAVYTDPSAGSTIIVKRVNDEYRLDGSFFHNDKEWTLRPLTKSNRENEHSMQGSLHQIVPVNVGNTTISFINDVLLDTESRREPLSTLALTQNGDQLKQESTDRRVTSRHKRATVQHVIEIAFVADFEDYSKWRRHVGAENVLSAMRLWYTFIAESISIRYQTIQEPDFAINISVTVVKILTNPSDALFISNLVNANGVFRGSEGLNAFRRWYQKQSDIPASDHYMLMTGYDVMGSSGIAISSRMCSEYSMSICEDSFTGSLGGVAAHELGHSLSAVHDVDTTGPNACSDKDQYIMSTVFTSPVAAGKEGNPWRFSPCSVKSFKAYLEKVTCTLPEHTSGVKQLPVPKESTRAGQVLFRNAQCVLAFQDSRSSFCQAIQMQNGGLNSLCGGMYCTIPSDWMGSCQTVVPQEYTSCGTGKWCVTGRCVDIESRLPNSTSSSTTFITPSSITPPETATSPRSTSIRETLQSTESVQITTGLTTTSETIRNNVTNSLTLTQETTSFNVPSALAENTNISTTAATLSESTTAALPTATGMPTTQTTVTLKQLATSTFPTNSTHSGIADVSMCNYLIYLKKGTEWWHCVQRALGRTETAPRSIRRLPIRRRGRIFIRRFRFSTANRYQQR